MKAVRRLSPWLCAPILVLALVAPARGDPGRGVYANGKVYKVSITSGGLIQIQMGYPDSTTGIFTVGTDPDTQQAATYTSTYSVCRHLNKAPGEGLAVFNNSIYYAYTADTTCGQSSTTKDMSAFVVSFNLRDKTWTRQNRGPVYVNNLAGGTASGAAIVVFKNELYLFTDAGIYTSADGSLWDGPYPALETTDYEPLDAVTIFPNWPYPGARILIVYGHYTGSTANSYFNLRAAVWDGQLPVPSPLLPSNYYFGGPFSTFPDPIFQSGDMRILGRVALVTGTADQIGKGATEPAVQLFANAKPLSGVGGSIQHLEYAYGSYPGTWIKDTVVYPDGSKYPGTASSSVADLWAYPTSELQCEVPAYQALRQWIWVQWKDGSTYRKFNWSSDALVPQNIDPIVPMTCGTFGAGQPPYGTVTDTGANDPNMPDPDGIKKHYWTLVGVILGSPPFATNKMETELPARLSEAKEISKVEYGTETGDAVEDKTSTSQQVMVGAGIEVRAGFPEVASAKVNVDAEFKNTWEKSTTQTRETTATSNFPFGTSEETWPITGKLGELGEVGTLGWALFKVPKIVVQNWKAYAWDYSTSQGMGTSLDQKLYTIEADPGSTQLQSYAFDLANPSGIMKGIKGFPYSSDPYHWQRGELPYTWDAPSNAWSMRFGSRAIGDAPAASELTFTAGGGSGYSIATKAGTITSSGTTQDVSVTVTNTVSFGTKLNGFSATEKAGYEGVWNTDFTNTTSFKTDVSGSLGMKSCAEQDTTCITRLVVQPFWLEANPNATGNDRAPWIPDAYQNQHPWAITWLVEDLDYWPENSTTMVGAIRSATGSPPLNASGRIVNAGGGNDGGGPESHYSIQGGRLSWAGPGGVETRIPMTADDFDPSKGVTIGINDLSWSSLTAAGSWKRSGDIWSFQPDANAPQNRVMLTLDFARGTYDLQIQRADLNGRVPAGVQYVRLKLAINNRYTVYTILNHDIDITWQWSQKPADNATLHVTSCEGRYNSATQSGNLSLAGTLPAKLPVFGDMAIEINGHPYVAQLITMDGFQRAFQSGGTFKYSKEGASLVLDFGSKTWSATFNEKAFDKLFVPNAGNIRARILVGGAPWFSGDEAVLNYSANLTLQK
jgi:hypothetical protein